MSSLTFLIVFLILMFLIAVVPQILKKFSMPSIVSIMLVGIAIGPNALDLLGKLQVLLNLSANEVTTIYETLNALGLLGLMFLMALAGMEVNLKIIKKEKWAVFTLSVLTFIVPALAGYFIYEYFEPADWIGKLVYASLFASHSVGIVFPIIRELNIVKTRFGIAVLSSTVITDIASLILLAVCIQFKRHEISGGKLENSLSIFDKIDPTFFGDWFPVIFVGTILLFIVLSYLLIPIAAKSVLKKIAPYDDSRITFFLAGLLIIVFLGELIGISIIVSAFVGGMAMVSVPALHEQNNMLHKKIEGLGYGFMIPFLFLTIGMQTDLSQLVEGWSNLAIVGATVLGLVLSKVLSGLLAMKLAGFSTAKGVCAGLMTVPQLSATLAAAKVALELNMIDGKFFNAIVCLSILTTLPIPTLVKLIIERCKIKFTHVENIDENEDFFIDENLM